MNGRRAAIRAGARAALAAAWAAAPACRAPETVGLTELVVLVDTDLAVPDGLDRVRVAVDGPAGFRFDRTVALDERAAPRMPLTLGLVHDRGSSEPVTITVTATGPGDVTLTQTAVTGFVPRASRLVPFVLTDACLGATCAPDRTCTGRDRCDLAARDPGALPPSIAVTNIAAGQFMACARLTTGAVECWGRSVVRADLPPLPLATPTPTAVANLPDAVSIAVGDSHGCAARADGTVACWGDGRDGMLGLADVTLQPDAVTVPGVSGAAGLALGRSHSCARLASGDVLCWGGNGVGQLGDGSSRNASVSPVRVMLPEPAEGLDAGTIFSCARVASGAVYCWGFNGQGQLGDGSTVRHSPVPVRVTGIDDAVEVATGADYACARRRAGEVVCRGSNDHGQLGDGTLTPRNIPAPVAGPAGGTLRDAVQLALGSTAACARIRGGRVLCWGANSSGQLGDGTTTERRVPAPVLEGGARPFEDALAVTAGSFYACVINRQRTVLCWGINQDRQLGTESSGSLVVYPRAVVGLP